MPEPPTVPTSTNSGIKRANCSVKPRRAIRPQWIAFRRWQIGRRSRRLSVRSPVNTDSPAGRS